MVKLPVPHDLRIWRAGRRLGQWMRGNLKARVQEHTAALATAQVEIQQSRDQLQAIIDSLGDELVVIDLAKQVTRVNAALIRRYGNDKKLIGQPCCEIAHAERPCHSSDCACPFPMVVDTGKPVRVTHTHRVDGQDRKVEVIASPLLDAGGQVCQVVELLRDVTEETELRETILQRNRELSAVNAIARVVGQSLKLDECLSLALGEVRRITQMDMGSIFLVEAEDGTLRLHACYGISEQGAEIAARQALSDSACGGVLQIGEPIVVHNPARNARLGRDDRLASLVHIPLITKGMPVGTLCLGTKRSTEFQPEQISLLNAIGNQIAVAVENARLYEELSRKDQLRGELLRRVISVQEEERKRIARELHDETTQTLTALLYALDAVEVRDSPKAQPAVQKMRQLTRNAIDGIHKLIFDLRPTMLDQLGLVAALRWYAETRLGESDVHVHVTERGQVRRLPPALETALFRTVQESISNIARHAGARHVRIEFQFGQEQIEIRVEDDGIGFDMAQVDASRDPRCGLGLVSMYERLSAVGGEFFLTSAPAQGTTIRLCAPIEGGPSGADSSTGRG
jgi:PAS domain S-box-containing protein